MVSAGLLEGKSFYSRPSFRTSMKVLFVCNQNRNRSKTAERLFSGQFETKSAGLYNETPITAKQLSWADVVVVMEDEQRAELGRRFPKEYLQKWVVSLGIPDVYKEGQPILEEMLAKRLKALL